MIFSSICAPTIIYIAFSMIKILIDIYKGIYDNAFKGIIVMVIISLVINILCDLGLTVIAWIFVFVPIIMMTIISTLLLKVFDFDLDKNNIESKIIKDSNSENNSDNIDSDNIDSDNIDSDNIDSDNIDSDNIDSDNIDSHNNYLSRINRDNVRDKLYDNLDDIYNFSYISSSYNVPENIVEYSIVNNYINRR